MEGLELTSFQIISAAGSAKSMFMDAIHAAKEKDFALADKLLEEGNEMFVEAHKIHAQLIQQEANGQKVEFALLLMHAEDQLLSTDTIYTLAQEIIDVYKEMHKA